MFHHSSVAAAPAVGLEAAPSSLSKQVAKISLSMMNIHRCAI